MEARGIDLIENPEKLRDFLASEGHVTFILLKKRKKFFKKQIDRIRARESLVSKKKHLIYRVLWPVYAFYVLLFELLISSKERELEYAFVTYAAMWPYIKSIAGDDYSDDRIKITYKGRKR